MTPSTVGPATRSSCSLPHCHGQHPCQTEKASEEGILGTRKDQRGTEQEKVIREARRPSTRQCYKYKWKRVSIWCVARSWNPMTCAVNNILQYCLGLARAGLTVNSIKVHDSTVDNAQLVLQIDNARLAADDFRVKYEAELAIRTSVEMDIAGLRKVIDDTNMNRLNLENEIESLREELIFLKKNHEDELNRLQSQISSCGLTVEVDAPKSQDLAQIMTKIRSQYEELARKNKEDAKNRFEPWVDEITVEVTENTLALQSARSTVTDLRRTMQGLEIDLESMRSLKANLEGTLRDTEARYGMEVDHINSILLRLEADLTQVRNDIQCQAQDYEILFNIKMKLEAEIETYRRLLDGGDEFKLQDALTQSTTQMVQKVITTTQQIVDGKVVSESNDTKVLKH